MKEIKERSQLLINQLIVVWENAVRETHLFLSKEEIEKIKHYVSQALSNVPLLVIETNKNNIPIAFMGIKDRKLEMLFITPKECGKGLGRKLIEYAIENCGVNEVCVNEQNLQAKGFYEHIGFKTYNRTELDEQGNPYPVLYMRLEQ